MLLHKQCARGQQSIVQVQVFSFKLPLLFQLAGICLNKYRLIFVQILKAILLCLLKVIVCPYNLYTVFGINKKKNI